jgi:hypothetical protein
MPNSNVWVWTHKMVVVSFGGPQKLANALGVKFEFGSLPKRTNSPTVKFDFGPSKPKGPQWAPKMGNRPTSKIWVLETPQKDKFTQRRIWVWAHNNDDILVCWALKIGESPRRKIWVWELSKMDKYSYSKIWFCAPKPQRLQWAPLNGQKPLE